MKSGEYRGGHNVKENTNELKRDDAGFLVAGFSLQALKLLRTRAGAMLASGVMVGGLLGIGNSLGNRGMETGADLDKAGTAANIELIAFDENYAIDVAEAYFDVKLQAENITYEIDSKPVDVVQDCSGNKQLDGLGVVDFSVPFGAISQRKNVKTQKVDLVVDPEAVTAEAHWHGAGPEVRDYTRNDGGKNFGDRGGFCQSVFRAIASNARLVNLDSLGNVAEDLDKGVNHDLRQKGLELFGEQCPPQLEPQLRGAITEALERNVAALGRADDIGQVSIAQGELQWQEKPEPEEVKEYQGRRFKGDYQINNFTVDSVRCDVEGK